MIAAIKSILSHGFHEIFINLANFAAQFAHDTGCATTFIRHMAQKNAADLPKKASLRLAFFAPCGAAVAAKYGF